jgi:hypothetical protein
MKYKMDKYLIKSKNTNLSASKYSNIVPLECDNSLIPKNSDNSDNNLIEKNSDKNSIFTKNTNRNSGLKRKYDESFLKYGFIECNSNNDSVPLCNLL